MRHMAGDGKHQVVVLGRHDLDVCAERFPETGQPFDRGGIGLLWRRENAPPVDEQLRETGIGAGMFGAGDRMAGNEMDPAGNVRPHCANDVAFDRTYIGDGRAGFEVRTDLSGDRTAGADWHADNHEIGIGHRDGSAIDDLIGKSELGYALPRRVRPRRGDDRLHQTQRSRCPRNRTPDQADADQCKAIEQRNGGAHLPSKKSFSAATTRRLASSVPTDRRSAFGSL